MNTQKRRSYNNEKQTILFVLGHEGFFRNFQGVIEKLAMAGFRIHVLFASKHKSIGLADYDIDQRARTLITLQQGERTRPVQRGKLRTVWNGLLLRLRETARAVRDIVFYSRQEFDLASDLRSRVATHQNTRKPGDAAGGTPEVILSAAALNRLLRLLSKPPLGYSRAVAEKCFALLERMLPPAAVALDTIEAIRPAMVIVSPYVDFGSRTIDFVKAAHVLGIPTVLAVASWDNLTNKGIMKLAPRFVSVWNEPMAEEAKALHNFPQDRIWITGAPLFDRWFGRTPTRDRATFAKSLGFDPQRPIILYACSSSSIAGQSESETVKQWIQAIRASPNSDVATSNLLIRPHPMSLATWTAAKPASNNQGEYHTSIVWPLTAKYPSNVESGNDLFDSLYHADAVVGLNTSVMIEASILRKPILTFYQHEHKQSQTGNLHYRHLANAKILLESMTLHEHVDLLVDVLRKPERVSKACDQFVADFVRPLGRDRSASEELVGRVIARCKATTAH